MKGYITKTTTTSAVYHAEFANRHSQQTRLWKDTKEIFISKKKNHLCDICTQQFNTKYSLEGHMRSKHGIKLKCERCGSMFAFRHSLKEHRERCNPTEVMTFQCTECQSQFTTQRALNSHKESKHEGKKYICEICAREFSYNGSYNRHRRLIHKL